MLQELYGNRPDNVVIASGRESRGVEDRASRRSRPTATGLLIGAEDSVEKLKKKRMQEEYRRQLEEQILGSKSAESKLRPGASKRRTTVVRDERPLSLDQEKQQEVLAKRRQQEVFRANLDVQMQERQAMKTYHDRHPRDEYVPELHPDDRNNSYFGGSEASSYDPRARRHESYGAHEHEHPGPYDHSGNRGVAAQPKYSPDAMGYQSEVSKFERMDIGAFQGTVAPHYTSPNVARQRMLEDVYGQKASATLNEDIWRPGKPSAMEQEKRRQSMEHQRALLEQQMQESSRMKNEAKATHSATLIRTDFNAVKDVNFTLFHLMV